jgi:hypothetical protein
MGHVSEEEEEEEEADEVEKHCMQYMCEHGMVTNPTGR